MNRKTVLTLALLVIGTIAWAQCDFEPSEKLVKLIEKAGDKKKYDSEKRYEFFQDALEMDENCWPCIKRLGEVEFKRAKRGGGSFSAAEAYFNDLIERCPGYHSAPHYYMGAINYATQNYALATEHFEKFLHFPDDNPDAFDKDYDKKYIEVEGALPDVKFWDEFYNSDLEMDPRIVEGVSSSDDDYLPAVSPDGEIMFYTRKMQKKAKGDLYSRDVEEFTWSRREGINDIFDDGAALPAPFNQGDNYGGATISVDNKEMFIAKKNPVAGNPDNIDLYYTHYELYFEATIGKNSYRWTALESLGPNINTDDGWEAQPSLSGDGKLLFFAKLSAETEIDKNGNPSHDIYVSARKDDGSWGVAKPIGSGLNTTGQEKSPFMHSDSKTLYFASDGHRGRGGMDIFYCKMNDEGGFSEPKNIGHPINTENDESGLIVSADGERAYFFSRIIRGSRGYDIYAFELPEKAKPEKVMILKGSATDESGEALTNATVEITYAQSRIAQEIQISEDDGRYAAVINLERNEDVIMSVKKEGIAFNSRIVANVDIAEKPSVVKFEVKAQQIAKNKPFLINDIYYSTNSAEIDRASKIILDQFALYLLDHPRISIEIRGHTDDIGSEGDNLALSMDRAFEVKGYLEAHGISGKRIKDQGFGESKPVSDNGTTAGRSQNRRTEFVVNAM
jgi:outer membrane protein OmpA-like peptidoglycan-associated protein/tetratricopeptide (TPR) repeat protein